MKKIFSILVLALAVMTASAYDLTTGTLQNCTVAFTVDNVDATTADAGKTVTVTVTPSAGYATRGISVKAFMNTDEMKAPQHRVGFVEDIEATAVDGNVNAFTFIMPDANVEVTPTIEELVAATISFAEATPEKKFSDDTYANTLTNTGDGTVSYASDNIAVATVDAESGQVTFVSTGTATITATATDNETYTYKGMDGYNSTSRQATVSYTLTVAPGDMTVSAPNVDRSFSPTDSYGITVNVTKPASGATVTYGTTAGIYTLSASPTFSNIGTYTVYYKVTAPNYNDYVGQATVTINKASGYVYYPKTQVNKTYGDASFVNEVVFTGDGTMSYASSKESVATVDAATGLVTIKGVGTTTISATMSEGDSYLEDWHSYTLTVGKADLSKATIALAQTSYEYDGSEKKPAVLMVVLGNSMLQADAYSVGYGNNVNAGTATVTVSGQGNYTGEASTTFAITPKTITDDNVTIVDGGTDNRQLTIHDKGNQQGGIVTPDLEVSTLNYDRSLPASEVNAYTVCLPYAPSTEGGLKYYTLTGVEGTTLQFTEISGAPLAYTPYLVFASSSTDIGKTGVTNVTMRQEVDGSTAGSYELKGTLSGISHDDAQGFYILQSGNRWAKIGSDTHAYIPPFRAYIVPTAAAPAPAVDYLDNEFHDAGSATGIDSMRTTDRNGTERWFDLNGRRIEKPTTKGIYIRNGRKEIAK